MQAHPQPPPWPSPAHCSLLLIIQLLKVWLSPAAATGGDPWWYCSYCIYCYSCCGWLMCCSYCMYCYSCCSSCLTCCSYCLYCNSCCSGWLMCCSYCSIATAAAAAPGSCAAATHCIYSDPGPFNHLQAWPSPHLHGLPLLTVPCCCCCCADTGCAILGRWGAKTLAFACTLRKRQCDRSRRETGVI